MEIAFISANKLKIELDNKQGGLSARILHFFAQRPSKFIGTMLLGNNVALVVYGIWMAKLLEDPVQNIVGSNQGLILLTQTVVSTLLVLITAEFLPKTIFRINPNRVLSVFSVLLYVIYLVFWIPVFVTIGLSDLLIRLFSKDSPDTEKAAFSKIDLDDYLSEVAERASEKEELDHEVHLFQNALNFSKVIARDCMVPRNEIIAIDVATEVSDLVQKFIDTGLSKIVVYRDSIDNIIGYVHSFELLKQPETVKNILLPVNIIPETAAVDKVLNELQDNGRSIAIVVDEFGGTSGMVTVEDIMEEIFGEIEDEHDQEDLIESKRSENCFVFSARHEIDYLNEKYSLGLPVSEEYETLAGYILSVTEDIPLKGEKIETEDFELTILESSKVKIELVQIEVKEAS